jgi:peptide/nickel transport system ATP-binding protein
MTIGEAIMEPMMVHGLYDNLKMRTERKIELLEMVGLKADDSKKFPHQFSGGQRQRICISRSLALNPSFLIFDESVSALDLSIQSQILNLVMDLRGKLGFSGLFISHNLSVIHYISDRVLVLQKGKIVEQGDTEQVFSDPQHHYTKQLVDFSLRNGASG